LRKRQHDHVNHERWLVSYADFITLLFAFFVVMYAISQTDLAKLQAVQDSMREAFGMAGPVGMIDMAGTGGGKTINPMDERLTPGGRIVQMPAGRANISHDPDPQIKSLIDKLEESLSVEIGVTDYSENVTLRFDERGLVVRLAAKDLFERGSSKVQRDLRPLINRIGKILKEYGFYVRIEGHADESEKNSYLLSSARATWVAKYWIKKFAMQPKRISVAGYGKYRPISKSKTKWSSGVNRRVEIIILPSKPN